MKRFNAAEAVANQLGRDIEDVKDYVYHYGRTTRTVFAIGNVYYCATKGNQKPAQYKDERNGVTWTWVKCREDFMNAQHGWIVWREVIS